MKKLFVFFLAVLASSLTYASTINSINCDNLSNWTTGNIVAGDTFTVTQENSDIKEGTGCLKVNYVSGSAVAAWNRSSYISYVFTTPVDLSNMEYITYWNKTILGASVATAGLNLMVTMEDENNLGVRYYVGSQLNNTSWAKKTIRLSDFETNIWLDSGKNPNLSRIKKINFALSQGGALAAGDQLTYLLDNIQITGNTGSLAETTIADFEGWSATDASNLLPAFTRPATTYSVLMNEGARGTSKSLKIVGALAGANSNYGVKLPLTQVTNLSSAVYFRASIKGLSAYTTITPVMSMFLVDTAGNRAVGMAYGVVDKEDGFRDVYFRIKNKGVSAPANSDVYGWIEDNYDAGGSTGYLNYSAVSQIWLGLKGVSGSYDTTEKYMIVDEIKAGFMTNYAVSVDTSNLLKKYVTNNVATAPSIDGVISANEWPSAFQSLDSWAAASSASVPVNTSFKLMNDNNYIYLLLVDVNTAWNSYGETMDDSTSRYGDQLGVYFMTRGNAFTSSTDPYHTIFLPNLNNGRCYIWDEKRWGGINSWTASNDSAAFTYSNNTMIIEYRIPYTDFNGAGFAVTGKPEAGSVWGLQVTSSPSTGNNYCWYGEAGSYAGVRPMPGVLVFGSSVSFANSTTVVTLGKSVDLSVTGGLSPYTWSFNSASTVLTSAQGTINSSTADSVTFTATAVGTVQLYCKDAMGVLSSGYITVVPTSAPLASELMD